MTREIRPAIVLLLVMTVITGLAYPLAITGLARLLFAHQAGGSLVMRDGRPVGSELIGQVFADPGHFHARPSATVAPDPKDASATIPAPYNAANSGGSNLAPTAKALVERVEGEAKALHAEAPGAVIPPDLLTTSASGLDPHVSPEAALFQVPRIARARGMDEAVLRGLVAAHVETPLVGLIGERRVKVRALNLALDAAR